GAVRGVAFSDGTHFVTTGADGSVRLWDARTRHPVWVQTGHGPVNAVAVRPDGSILAAGCNNGRVAFRDGRSGEASRTSAAHDAPVLALAFSPDGLTLATGGADQRVRLWNVQTGERIGDATRHGGRVTGVAFRPGGRELASVGEDRSVRLWDLDKKS